MEVLTNGRTASSGEVITVVFRGRPDTRSFGAATAGYSTTNATIFLSDGAMLNLTVSVYGDRNKHAYGNKIEPDVMTDDALSEAVPPPYVLRFRGNGSGRLSNLLSCREMRNVASQLWKQTRTLTIPSTRNLTIGGVHRYS
ncbi:S41 family peptidase [Lewinella sp. IMCC34191]|uniref:S41 family peptidase n=1 Tax=Lewinella sp. IMCC34191 TaxID=2259172 RepID=UPI000E2587CB|nr:S41 family peptidase [Lewinella sp. IMCC34191]